MEENDIQSPSKTHGGPLAIKREAEAVQDQPPALLSIFLRPVPTAGARLFARRWCVGQRGLPAVRSVWLRLLGRRSLLRLSALDGSGARS